MTDPIRFYSLRGAYREFSNFSPHPIELRNRIWPTTEHYFQAQKFSGTEHEEEIRLAKSPMIAARLGRARSKPLRADWEHVKEDIMREALRAKFTQHANLKELLLKTKKRILIEHTRNDRYWGDGGDGTGRNRLGILLMELRDHLACDNSTSTTTLFRPVGPGELELIKASGNREFPPRLPDQPIFYPVLNEEYARQIALDWNVPASGSGYVTRFEVRSAFLERYPEKIVGASIHRELWIPAEDLAEMNRNIVGKIEVTAEFHVDSKNPSLA
jgi:ribA/ribD-fused uncharacterized protein